MARCHALTKLPIRINEADARVIGLSFGAAFGCSNATAGCNRGTTIHDRPTVRD